MSDIGCWAAPQGSRSAGRAPHQKKLKLDQLPRAVGIILGAHAAEAVAQPPLQRAKVLSFQAAERIRSSWHCAQGR